MCDIMDVETQDNLQYVFFPVSSGAVRFKVKAANDAHVALTKGNYENNPMTEILIGAWGNTKSAIRRDRCGDPDVEKLETPGILNRYEYVGIWIRWHSGCIAAGLEGSDFPFIFYKDPSPHQIDHVAVKTGWGSTGSWKIEVSPVMFRPITPKPVSGKLHWVRMSSNDEIPTDAVIGGFEGEVVYVARARHNRSLCPGKYVPSMKRAVVPWGHRAHKKDRFEILCGYNLMWVKTAGDYLPPHAFPGGTSAETHNEELFIGRAQVDNNLIPGKVHLHYKTCYLPYGEVEKEVLQFEVLVEPEAMPKQLIWNGPRRENDLDAGYDLYEFD